MPYAVRRVPRHESLRVRGLTFQLYHWPAQDPQPTVLLHGWGDTGETFQFLADALAPERTLVSFDMRGFGRTQRPEDGYWFPDYLADLDAILDHLSPQAPLDLVGHSMGGNVAMLYAGVRPHRVRRLVSLEGFGLARTTPDQAPARYAEWLDEVKHEAGRFATYETYDQLIRVLARRNPRTAPERLELIARSWARETEPGRIELWADPKHKRANPVLYQRDQAEACWRAITAPLLFVSGDQSELTRQRGDEFSIDKLQGLFADVTAEVIAGAGHMLHHEQPETLAPLLERFLTRS
jgi:pimeloyl-ACP methyl ester carboxylesterase